MKQVVRVVKCAIVVILVWVYGQRLASSATATSNLSVTATVTANCTIATNTLAFGNYDPIVANAASALNGTGSVTITCTNGSSATITLDQGANPGGGSTNAIPLRRMTDGSNFLSYFLYQNSSRTTVWGNTAGTGVAATGTGTAAIHTVYGQVTAAQNLPAGNYSDTVVATVTF
ncbi:MAG: Csu type fimbrial protein [Methylococcales bacterium]